MKEKIPYMKIIKSTLLLVSTLLTFSSMAKAEWRTETRQIPCSSVDHKYQECETANGAAILQISINKVLSKSACFGVDKDESGFGFYNTTYGFVNNKLWVANGCRAIFNVDTQVWYDEPKPVPAGSCSTSSFDGKDKVTFKFIGQDYLGDHIQVTTKNSYSWVMLGIEFRYYVGNASNVYCSNGSQDCHWTFTVPAGYAFQKPISFVVDATNDIWSNGRTLGSCFFPANTPDYVVL